MKIYIAGKITGDPNYKRKFAKAAKCLSKTHTVMNPAILPDGFEFEEYMKICKSMIDVCDAVYFLPDWKQSTGAQEEYLYALSLGKKTALFKHEKITLTKILHAVFWVFYESKGKSV